MKTKRHLLLATALALLAGSLGSRAQTDGSPSVTPNTRERVGRVVVPERPTAVDAPSPTTTVRPTRPERNALAPEVQRRIEQFKREAREYVRREDELRRQMLGVSEAERIRLREHLNAMREQWREKARQMREEFKDRLPELRAKLPEHRELLENAREGARDAAREAQGNVRRRRGEE